MQNTHLTLVLLAGLGMSATGLGQTLDSQLEIGIKTLEARSGCFLTDYNFAETEPLKAGYVHDNRIYDVSKKQNIKEWIFTEQLSPTRIRLQHVLMVVDLSGKVIEHSLLKHTDEDWEYNAPYLYEYNRQNTWTTKGLKQTPGQWTRRVTNLDDGPRYQCSAAWATGTEHAEWSCVSPAPIPGRETRDMHRHDYNELDRASRIILYGQNWLEREENTKVTEENAAKTPLVKEEGKIWYARLPDSECAAVQEFVKPRLAFWKIVVEAWDQVLTGDKTFIEQSPAPGKPSRYEQIMRLETEYMQKDLSNPVTASEARTAVLQAIDSLSTKQ
jgi:hypothetical protein